MAHTIYGYIDSNTPDCLCRPCYDAGVHRAKDDANKAQYVPVYAWDNPQQETCDHCFHSFFAAVVGREYRKGIDIL